MRIKVYSDESGVLDKVHNDVFVFGGIIFLDDSAYQNCVRKYSAAEKTARRELQLPPEVEVKASNVNSKYRQKLFRALNNEIRFGVIVDQKRVLDRIFLSKKDKQRYLDYVFKIAVKRCFEYLISKGVISPDEVTELVFYADEHTTATNGKYELREALEQEFKLGTYSVSYDRFFPPLFPKLRSVELQMCNSSKKTMIRAADVIANRIYHIALNNISFCCFEDDLHVINLP